VKDKNSAIGKISCLQLYGTWSYCGNYVSQTSIVFSIFRDGKLVFMRKLNFAFKIVQIPLSMPLIQSDIVFVRKFRFPCHSINQIFVTTKQFFVKCLWFCAEEFISNNNKKCPINDNLPVVFSTFTVLNQWKFLHSYIHYLCTVHTDQWELMLWLTSQKMGRLKWVKGTVRRNLRWV
jgi:hypothetical protein